jgi:hypothetical protein
MDYLTQYYKNRTVQLQEELIRLTTLVESRNIHSLNEGSIIDYFTKQYGTYALYLAAVAAGHVKGWWETVTPEDMIMTGVSIALPMQAIPYELMGQDMQTSVGEQADRENFKIVAAFARRFGYPKISMEDWIAAGRPRGDQMAYWFSSTYPSNIKQVPGIINHQLEYEPMGPPAPTQTRPTQTPPNNVGGGLGQQWG